MKTALAVLILATGVIAAARPPRPGDVADVKEFPATRPTSQPATQPTKVDREKAEVINLVVRDWLAVQAGRPNGGQAERVAMLLEANVPAGFRPAVENWTVLPVEARDFRSPPREVTAGDVKYIFD